MKLNKNEGKNYMLIKVTSSHFDGPDDWSEDEAKKALAENSFDIRTN